MTGELDVLIYWIGMAGTVAFAVTAVLAVTPQGINILGATVLGIITAIGGGTMRDVILDVPVFWAVDQNYIWVAFGASVTAFAAHSLFSRKGIYSLLLYVDGVGAAMFAIQAADKVWDLDFGRPVAPVLLGILTGIGGGLTRDVLAGRQNLLMTRELYATPILLGCTFYVLLLEFLPEYRFAGAAGCCLFISGLRAAAIHWELSFPEWLTTKSKTK